MIYLLCAVTKFSVVFCQQVQTILVHADTLALRVFRKCAVQRLRKPQLELTGILVIRRRLRNLIAIFQRGSQPFAFAVLRVLQRRFRRLAAGQAAAQLRLRGYKTAFVRVRNKLQTIRKIHIILNRLHDLTPRFLQLLLPS